MTTESTAVRVVLVGAVAHRPRTLNPIGPEVRRGRSIPVMIGDAIVGVATTEQYPDVDSGAAEFEAELDPAQVSASWHGKRIPILLVEQSRTWPGPFPVRIVVAFDAEPC